MPLQQYSFGAGTLYMVPQGLAVPAPIQVGTLQETSIDLSWSSKDLNDSYDAAAAIARGALKLSGKIKAANFRIADINAVVFGGAPQVGQTETVQGEGLPNGITIPAAVTLTTSSASTTGDVLTFTSTTGVVVGQAVSGTGVTAGSVVTALTTTTVTLNKPVASGGVASGASITFGPSITVANAAGFAQDLGVMNALTGALLTPVASAPATGEYSVSGGTYVFASADEGGVVVFDYAYAQTTKGQSVTYYAQKMGPRPTFIMYLSNKAFMNNPAYAGQPLGAIIYAAGIDKFSLDFKNEDWTVPETDFSASRDWLGRVITLSADA